MSKISNNRYICIFLILMVVLSIGGYWLARLNGETSSYSIWIIKICLTHMELITIVSSIFIAVLTIAQNAKITEGKLIKELNSEFINNKDLAQVESKLEKYFNDYMRNGQSDKGLKLDINPQVGESERQALVNYLVHLEAISALVNNKVLRLGAINDLIAYRFFIALNNPIVQEWEIISYFYYYSGCIKLYKKWKNIMCQKHIPIPMKENSSIIEALAHELGEK